MKNKTNENKSLLLWGIISVVLIIGIWSFTYFDLKNDLENRGSFGDMFGGINALFSGLALAGIIFTILLQREDLKAQKDELRLSRQEFEEQHRTFKIQRFENTFFLLLKFRADYVGQLKHRDYKNSLGIDLISKLVMSIENNFSKLPIKEQDKFQTSYCPVFIKAIPVLDPYFARTLSILDWVDSITFTDFEDKLEGESVENFEKRKLKFQYQYISFLLTELSIDELKLMAYESLAQGRWEFQKYFDKYSMLSIFNSSSIPRCFSNEDFSQRTFEKYI